MICFLNKNFHFHEFNLINQREELHVEKVPMFKIHNVGTVPMFKIHNIGTSKIYDLCFKLEFGLYKGEK